MSSIAPFNYAQDYSNELKLRAIGIGSTVLAVALTIGAVTVDRQWQRTMILSSALGLVGVSRVAETARLTQARINQDVVDISDASRQQRLYEYMTSNEANANPAPVLEISPLIDIEEIEGDTVEGVSAPLVTQKEIELDEEMPHLLMPAGTREGKSNALRNLLEQASRVLYLTTKFNDEVPTHWNGYLVNEDPAKQICWFIRQGQRLLKEHSERPCPLTYLVVDEAVTTFGMAKSAGLDGELTDLYTAIMAQGAAINLALVIMGQSKNSGAYGPSLDMLQNNMQLIIPVKRKRSMAIKSLSKLSGVSVSKELRDAITNIPDKYFQIWLGPDEEIYYDVLPEKTTDMKPVGKCPTSLDVEPFDDDDDVIDVAHTVAARAATGAAKTITLDDGEELTIDWLELTYKLIDSYLSQGWTKTMILKDLGYHGSQYAKGAEIWEKLEAQFGSFDS